MAKSDFSLAPSDPSSDAAKEYAAKRLASAQLSLDRVRAELVVVCSLPGFETRVKYLRGRERDFALQVAKLKG